MHFKGLDLNLLVVLDALLEEESVSKAAQRLHVSQPAVSAALAKLRWHTNDELLEKVGRQIRLTPRAYSMIKPVKEILLQVESTVKGQMEIDPLSFEREFRISMTSYCAQVLLPGLTEKLVAQCPKVTCRIEEIAPDTVTRTKSGELDFCVTFPQTRLLNPNENFDETNHEPIFSDRWVLVAGVDNHRLPKKLDFDAFATLPYIETRPGGVASMVERTLDQLPNRPHPVLSVQTFDLALANVAESECVAIVPALIIGKQYRSSVQVIDPPFEIPEIEEFLVWHSRHDDDPGHRLFRTLLLNSSQHLRDNVED